MRVPPIAKYMDSLYKIATTGKKNYYNIFTLSFHQQRNIRIFNKTRKLYMNINYT